MQSRASTLRTKHEGVANQFIVSHPPSTLKSMWVGSGKMIAKVQLVHKLVHIPFDCAGTDGNTCGRNRGGGGGGGGAMRNKLLICSGLW